MLIISACEKDKNMTCETHCERSVKHRDGQNLSLLEQFGSAVDYDLFKLATKLAGSVATGYESGTTHQAPDHFEINSLGLIHRLWKWRRRSHFFREITGGLVMSFQREEPESIRIKPPFACFDMRVPYSFAPHVPDPKSIPPGRAREQAAETLPPFSDLVEIDCRDRGGTCYDPGGLIAVEPSACHACLGSGKEIILRNYLGEAFR